MEKRKEVSFEPEKQIDFVKLIDALDWSKEISPVELVQTVNKIAGLKGRKKYETNEGSFSALIKSFELRVSKFTETRFQGKDRFYSLKDGYTKEQIIHFAKTGTMLEDLKEVTKELKKDDSKYYSSYSSVPTEEVPKKKVKKTFPDDEALSKTAIILAYLVKGKGFVATSEIVKVKEEQGWSSQRSVSGKKKMTVFQEANEVCTTILDIPTPIKTNAKRISLVESVPDHKIIDCISLIESEEEKKRITEIVNDLLKEEKKEDIAVVKEEKPRIRIFRSSPEIGRSEFKEITETSTPIIYENSRLRWNKSLIANTLRGAIKSTFFSYTDLATMIKKCRFVDIPLKEIKELVLDIQKRFKGIFREISTDGFVINSEVLIKNLIDSYPQEKITETIFLRLKMSLEEIKERYPALDVEIASKIGDQDNIYKIEMNRSEKAERAFCKLIYCMRNGEVILESPNNWTIKRCKVLQDKFGLTSIY